MASPPDERTRSRTGGIVARIAAQIGPGRPWGVRALSGRRLAFDVTAALLLGVVGALPLAQTLPAGGVLVLQLVRSPPPPAPAALLTAVLSLAVRRLHPGAALLLAAATAAVQLSLGERLSVVELAIVVVVYTAAAHGRRWELEVAALGALVGGVLAPVYLLRQGSARYADLVREGPPAQRVAVVVLPFAVLGAAWLAGLAVRSVLARGIEADRRVVAEERAGQAQHVADVERLRATMARDVHDVVGHSLAVIIAQADAAEVVEDPDRVRAMVGTIARTARASLEEVRSVLDRTGAERLGAPDTLHDVIEQVRSTGLLVEDEVRGAPQELGQQGGVVARRVLQEMLTNALRHGRPAGVVGVLRSWSSAGLVVEVVNEIGTPQPGTGAGLAGMRSRLASIGGTLDTEALDGRFVATARIPATVGEVMT